MSTDYEPYKKSLLGRLRNKHEARHKLEDIKSLCNAAGPLAGAAACIGGVLDEWSREQPENAQLLDSVLTSDDKKYLGMKANKS